MTQQTIGALVFSLIIVSFFVVSDENISFLAERNVAQTMNGTGAFVGSSAPANVSGSGGFGSSPANPTPSTNTPPPSANNNDKKPPEASSAKCTEGQKCSSDKAETITPKGKCTQNDPKAKAACEANLKKAQAQVAECREDAKNPAKECKENAIASAEYDETNCVVTLTNGKKVKCQDEDKIKNGCPTVSSTNGKSCNADSKEPGCECKGNAPDLKNFSASDGKTYDIEDIRKRLQSGGSISGAEGLALEEAELASESVLQTGSGGDRMNLGGPSAGVNQGAGSAFGGQTSGATGASGSGTSGASGTSGGGAGGAPASTGGSAGAGSGQGSGNTSGGGGSSAQSPTTLASPTYGGGNPVSTAPGASGNPASAPNTNASGVNTGSHYGGQGVSNYQSLQQYQPYGGNSPIAQFAQNMLGGQQPLQQELVPQQGIQSAISVSPPPRQNTVASMLRQFIQSVSGATAPAQEGVVYYQNEPIAYYRTEDGAIVIDRVRVPRQTPQGTASDPMDIAQALAVQDVSVAARIRSEVASGGITLAVPVNPNDQNQAFVNIENLIVQDEVADALRIAEEAGVSAKDTIGCEVNETAENCLARRIAAAQEIERRVFVDELNRRPLSANAVAHFIGLYDGVANSGTTVYTGSVPSILSQLNTPQQTTVVGTIVDAMDAAIDSVVGFISWMFGADN